MVNKVGADKRRRDGLADVDTARNHDAVHRRANDRIAQIDLRLIHRRLGLAHLGLSNVDLRARRIVCGLRRVQFALRHQFALLEFFGAFQSPFGIFKGNFRFRQVGLGGQHIGAGFFDTRGESRLIELARPPVPW